MKHCMNIVFFFISDKKEKIFFFCYLVANVNKTTSLKKDNIFTNLPTDLRLHQYIVSVASLL